MSKTISFLRIPHASFALAFVGLIICWLPITQVAAQDEGPSTVEKDDRLERVTESKLETFYLRREEDGKLVPFFKIPFEKFDELYKLYEGAGRKQLEREYSFSNIEVTGKVEDEFAELKIDIEILSLVDGWTSVPLRLDGLVLEDAVGDLGKNEFFVSVDEEKGYRLWLKSSKDKTSKISLSGFREVQTIAGESRLNLNLPSSPYSSLKLDVPGKISDADASDDSFLEKLTESDGNTRLSVRGPKGDFQLAWQSASKLTSQEQASIFSTARIVVRVEGRNNIRLQAEFDLEAFGGNLGHVDVRLPAGVELIPIDQPDVAISLLPENTGKSADGKTDMSTPEEVASYRIGRVARVSFARPTKTPAPFSLVGNLRLKDAEEFDLGGFEVIGAVRQIGSIEVVAEKKWSVVQVKSDISRVPAIAADIARQPVYARYEFEQQPFGLQLKVAQTPSRSRIEPVHVARIGSETVNLTTRLLCRFEGVAPDVLSVDVGDWNVDLVGPRSLVEGFEPDKAKASTVNIRLTDYARQAFRDPQIELALSRKTQPKETAGSKTEFVLPQPVSTSIEPAVLIVYSENNVELRVIVDKLSGLAAVDLPKEFEVDSGQQAPLAFRKDSLAEKTHFAASLTVQTRKIESVSELEVATARVRIPGKLPKNIFVKQTSVMNIRFEPTDELFVRIPRSRQVLTPKEVATADDESSPQSTTGSQPDPGLNLSFLLDNQSRGIRYQEEFSDERNAVFEIDLPGRIFGEHTVVARYELATPDIRYLDPVPFDIWVPAFLVSEVVEAGTSRQLVPIESLLATITTANNSSAGASVYPAPEKWAMESETENEDVPNLFVPDEDFTESVVEFYLEPSGMTNQRARIADKIFLQTNLFRTKRYERFALRIETRAEPLKVSLPLSAELISAHVNGVEAKATEGSLIEFDITDRTLAEHVIEILYQMPQTSNRSRYVSCIVPTIEDVSSSRELYWELITPNDEHFVGAQSGLMPVLNVEWKDGWFLTRSAAMEHKLLENWVGIPPQSPPDRACNRYVFSSFGPIERYQVLIADRRDMMLCAAGIVLLIGLLVTVFPRVRHPMNLLALVVVGAVFFFRYPDLMLMFLQVATITILAGTVIYLIQMAFRHKSESFRRVYWSDDNRAETDIVSQNSAIFGSTMDLERESGSSVRRSAVVIGSGSSISDKEN